jgi:hypothetical protein
VAYATVFQLVGYRLPAGRAGARGPPVWPHSGPTDWLRALLARVHGDETGYRGYRDRYRALATSLGFEGQMKWADAMA